MKEVKWIEKKKIEGKDVYKVICVVDGLITNVLVIVDFGNELVMIHDAADLPEVQKFVNNMDEVHAVNKKDETMIKVFLGEHKAKTRKSFTNLMNSIEMGGDNVEFISSGGEYFSVVKTDSSAEIGVAYQIISNTEGKITLYSEIKDDNQLLRLYNWRAQRMIDKQIDKDALLITGDTYAMFEKINNEVWISTVVTTPSDDGQVILEANSKSGVVWKKTRDGVVMESIPPMEEVMKPLFERAVERTKRLMFD